MQFWACQILRYQQSAKSLRQLLPHRQQFGRVDMKSDSFAEMHNLGQASIGRGKFCSHVFEPRLDLRQMPGRQMMKQGDMRVEKIALGRKVPLT